VNLDYGFTSSAFVGNILTNRIRLNSPYDPDYAVGGSSATGFT